MCLYFSRRILFAAYPPVDRWSPRRWYNSNKNDTYAQPLILYFQGHAERRKKMHGFGFLLNVFFSLCVQLQVIRFIFSAYFNIQLVICYDIFLPGSLKLCVRIRNRAHFFLRHCFCLNSVFELRKKQKKNKRCGINRFLVWAECVFPWHRLAKCTHALKVVWRSKLYNWTNSLVFCLQQSDTDKNWTLFVFNIAKWVLLSPCAY